MLIVWWKLKEYFVVFTSPTHCIILGWTVTVCTLVYRRAFWNHTQNTFKRKRYIVSKVSRTNYKRLCTLIYFEENGDKLSGGETLPVFYFSLPSQWSRPVKGEELSKDRFKSWFHLERVNLADLWNKGIHTLKTIVAMLADQKSKQLSELVSG